MGEINDYDVSEGLIEHTSQYSRIDVLTSEILNRHYVGNQFTNVIRPMK